MALVAGLWLGAAAARAAALVAPGETWRYMKGTSEASSPDRTAWRAVGFNDASWAEGRVPIYYGENLDGTLLEDMRGSYTSVFLRREFTVVNPEAFGELILRAISDDGFICWINGKEFARYNMPEGDVAFDGTSLGALQEPIPEEVHGTKAPASFLVPGRNVIAIHAFNASLSGSSDFVIQASVEGFLDETRPVMETIVPAPGALVRVFNTVEVIFNEPVQGVDAADLQINGVGAVAVQAVTPSQYVFEFAVPATGQLTARWIAGHGITDTSPSANPFQGGTWSYTFDPNAPLPGVIISEFMAENNRTLNDEDGDASDWIELFNAGTTTANLNGWFLTDDATRLAKWRIPDVSLPPNSYLVVFASDKNRSALGGRLHTNFKLSTEGEYLALVDPRTNVVSAFAPTYPPQQRDISYGRERSNPSLRGYFTSPTPGGPNQPGGPGFAPPVHFSRKSGTFGAPITVTLATSDPQAVIRYTFGTELPTETSFAYAGPITLNATTQLRARAFKPGLLPGPPRSEQYIQLTGTAVNFTSDLPIVIFHNHGAGRVTASVDQPVMISVFEPKNGVASLANPPDLSVMGRFRKRGSSTEGYPKASLAVEFWNEFGDDKDEVLLGMPEESDWVFYAPNNFEPVLFHNPFAFELSNQIGRYAPRTRFAEVFLSELGGAVTQSQYNGIYVAMEKIKRGKDRVNVDNLEPEHIREPEVSGGYMLKIDRTDPGESGFGAAGVSINYVDPKYAEIITSSRTAQRNYISSYINQFGTALNGANYRDPVNGYAKFVDVPAWIDHHLLNVLLFNVDALRLSAYFYKERGGKLGFGPIWDFDRAIGSTDGRDSNPRVWRSQSGDRGTDFFNYPWWGRMFSDLDFWQKYIDRWQELRRGPFSNRSLHFLADTLADQVRAAQPRERSRWGVAPRGGSYQSEVDFTKNWLRDRADWMDTQFVPPPVLASNPGRVEPGSQVTLQGTPGAIMYYTLDGSDPRLPGGALAPSARVYAGPIAVNANIRLMARALNSNHRNLTGANNPPVSSTWSGFVAGTFYTAVPDLVVTEVMADPPGPGGPSPWVAQDYEYLEILNRGLTPANLLGLRFTAGIDFVFTSGAAITTLAPGGRLLLVRNVAAFGTRHGSTERVAGEFGGALDNNGERLTLVGPVEEPIFSFRFDPTPWPMARGLGFSIVPVDETAPAPAWETPAHWRASGRVGGSPGQPDPLPPVITPVVVNEVLAHTDAPQLDTVELRNPTAQPAPIGGWWLTDDANTPKKYRVPAGVEIPPGGFALFTTEQFGVGPNGFNLSSQGDEIYLFSADAAGELTGHRHGYSFGATANGATLGRHVTSTGRDLLVPQRSPTLGQSNSGPQVGPVLISEIMYNPPPLPGATTANKREEFIEIFNAGATPHPLHDPARATNTWMLADAVTFAFPAGFTLPAGGTALVVGFDPLLESELLALFRAKHQIPAGVPIMGPFGGSLENAGERLELTRPDMPNAPGTPNAGFIPRLLVERIDYLPSAPWPPEANGSGASLQRRDPSLFSNDPASWIAAAPNPGVAPKVVENPDRDGDGLPNDWEIAHQLDPDDATGVNGAEGDPDGDGATNLAEYQAGTDPRNPQDWFGFTLATTDDDGLLLQFTARAGRSYTVQYKDALPGGAWADLAHQDPSGADRVVTIRDTPPGKTRFYRVTTPPR